MSLISNLAARIAALRPSSMQPPAQIAAAKAEAALAGAFAHWVGESTFEAAEPELPFVESAEVPPEVEEFADVEALDDAEWNVTELSPEEAGQAQFIFVAPLTGEGVGDRFVDSPELASAREELVLRAYAEVLGREPDAGGADGWLERAFTLQMVGATPAQIAADLEAGLKNSEEYALRAQAAPPAVTGTPSSSEQDLLSLVRQLKARLQIDG